MQIPHIELDDLYCVECNKHFTDKGFNYYSGNIQYGPAYFSDEGVLCSPQCALDHFHRRTKEGTLK